MAHLKLIKPFHDCKPGDVVWLPAVVARELQYKQIGHGGAIDTSNVKQVDFSVPTPEEKPVKPGVETVEPKPFKGTVAQIKKWLDDNSIDYSSRALKDELLKILEDA